MTGNTQIPLYSKLVAAYNDSDPAAEAQPLRDIRRAAFDRFAGMGFPTTKLEDWRHTNVLPFLKESFSPEVNMAATVDTALTEKSFIPGVDCYKIVLVNGVLSEEQSVLPHLAGVTVLPLSKAKHTKIFSEYFARETRINEHHFTTLNTALFSDGLFIEVKAGKAIDKPVHIVHAFTAKSELMVQPRHLFVMEANATASIIESITAPANTAPVLVNSVTEIEVKENAHLNHCCLQAMPQAISYLNHTEVREERYSRYSNYTFSLPEAAFIRNNLHIAFDGEYAEGNLYGLYLASGQQLVDNHTLVDHRVPNCNSNEWYKGILLDRAAGVFNGKIKVHQDAQKTNAFQKNNNILIDPKAKINTKPQLEIFADDVKCSHGCTVGRFDETALFYLRSRGIGEASAHTMLIEAFATDITEKLGIAELKEYLQQLITGFLK